MPNIERKDAWSLAEAGEHLVELIDMARETPQTVEQNGEPVAVVLSIDEWKRLRPKRETLAEFLLRSPLRGADLDITRDRSLPRDIDL